MRETMRLHTIEAFTLPEAWRSVLAEVMAEGREYVIQRGSGVGTKRRELDYVTLHIERPGLRPLAPDMPFGLNLPPPTNVDAIEKYAAQYLLTPDKTENEAYTYGQRIHQQLLKAIEMLKATPDTNQACIEVGRPEDFGTEDPPCLRLIDCRVSYGQLHFVTYWRSWDAYSGLPTNLGGLQLVKEFMASEIGVEDGKIIAASKGLHLYERDWRHAGMIWGGMRKEVT